MHNLVVKLISQISETQKATRALAPTKRLEGRERESYTACYPLMWEFYERYRPKPEETEDVGSVDAGDPIQEEEGILQSVASLSIGDAPADSAIPNRDGQAPRGQEILQNPASPSTQGAPANPAAPITGGLLPQKHKLRSYSKQKMNPQPE